GPNGPAGGAARGPRAGPMPQRARGRIGAHLCRRRHRSRGKRSIRTGPRAREWRIPVRGTPATPAPAAMNIPPDPAAPARPADIGALRAAITAAWTLDESAQVQALLAIARQPVPGWGAAER